MTSSSPYICAVIVTYQRRSTLQDSIQQILSQSTPINHLIVVDNDNDPTVKELLDTQPITTTYLGSIHNLGGAGGFALGILYALSQGAQWVWLADDDGRPADNYVLETLLHCAHQYQLKQVSPLVCSITNPHQLAFPLRRGLRWRRYVDELFTPQTQYNFLPGIASLFNGALFSATAIQTVGVPDFRLFIRGDEVEIHRRLVRSGLKFGTCLTTRYLHPCGSDEFKPILGGLMCAQYPDSAIKRYFTYRNRGYLMNQPGMRKLLLQEWLRFTWFFLISRHDSRGWKEWKKLHQQGRHEHFFPPRKGAQ